jgi:hypothetical protein
LITQRPGYLLRVAPDELDLDKFRRLADEGRDALQDDEPATASKLREALATWRGAALADFAFDQFA